MDEATRISGG